MVTMNVFHRKISLRGLRFILRFLNLYSAILINIQVSVAWAFNLDIFSIIVIINPRNFSDISVSGVRIQYYIYTKYRYEQNVDLAASQAGNVKNDKPILHGGVEEVANI